MKLRIVKDFKDKHTGARYKAGDILNFDDVRANELLAHPQGIVEVEEDTPEAPEEVEEVEVEKPKSKKKK